MSDLPTIFGNTVRARREALGLSQERLADDAGLHRTYIGSVERGERNLTLTSIARLAAGLKCRPADLLDEIPALKPE